MFGRRADGKQIKGIDGMTRLTPQIMRSRVHATNYFKLRIPAEKIDEFIAKRKAEGVTYTYRDVVIAVLVRVFKVRPKLNQFVVGGRFYQRNHIDLSMVVHKSLRTGDQESAVKVRFNGYETIGEVKEKLEKEIARATDPVYEGDGLINFLGSCPLWILRLFVRLFRLADHWGMLGDSFMFENSPFHASIFFSDLKSIKMDKVYHHLTDFGNCGFFLALGKDRKETTLEEDGKVVIKKIIDCGVSEDERFIDGLYFNRMIKSAFRLIDDLSVLERPLEESEIFPLKTWKEIKAERKAKKKAKKEMKKTRKLELKAAKKAARRAKAA